MNWKDILKDAEQMSRELDAMMNKPLPNLDRLKQTLIGIQRSYPQVFTKNENLTDLRGMISQMIEEADRYYSNTKQLQALNLKEQLMSVSDSLGRIEELE